MLVDITTSGVTAALIGLRAREVRLSDLRPEMEEASNRFYELTRQWYEAEGGGTWPPLAESTIARKQSQGASEPTKPLFFEGNLFESATSPNGPYSSRIVDHDKTIMSVDWDEGGWQIPMILAYGAGAGGRFPSGGHSSNWSIPARPIWPHGHAIERLQRDIGDLILRGI